MTFLEKTPFLIERDKRIYTEIMDTGKHINKDLHTFANSESMVSLQYIEKYSTLGNTEKFQIKNSKRKSLEFKPK